MSPAAELSWSQDLAFNFIGVLGEDPHVDLAIVDEDDVTDIDIVHEVLVIDIHGAEFLAFFAANRKRESLAWLQVKGDWQVTGADGWALGIHHDADRDSPLLGGGTHVLHHLANPIVRRMGHVESSDVQTGLD